VSVDWKLDLADARGRSARRWRCKATWTRRSCLGSEADSARGARGGGENRRAGAHPESGPWNLADDSRGKREGFSWKRGTRLRRGSSQSGQLYSGLVECLTRNETGGEARDRPDLGRNSRKIQPARPALHELSHRARVERRFRPGRPREILRARRTSAIARRFRSTCTFPSARAFACFARATYRFRKTRASRFPTSPR
jgi:hypothetical protein